MSIYYPPESSNWDLVDEGRKVSLGNLSYQDLVSQVEQNNAYSAEQAQRQMDFQEKVWREQMEFNSLEASKNRDYQIEQAALNRDFQQSSADQAMAFSAEQAKADRDWQEYMSSTAHQREMADLKAAGLNPVLAANKGAAISAGAMANSSQAAGSSVNGAQASSVQTPSGAKGDTDQQGTYAIMTLLGKMLDNEVAREQMANNAEIARNQAEMYTAATRYAAELSQMATMYSADQHYHGNIDSAQIYADASRYATDVNAASQAQSWSHAMGRLINLIAGAFDAEGLAETVKEGFGYMEQGGRYALEQNYGMVAKVVSKIADFLWPNYTGHWGKTTSNHFSGKF